MDRARTLTHSTPQTPSCPLCISCCTAPKVCNHRSNTSSKSSPKFMAWKWIHILFVGQLHHRLCCCGWSWRRIISMARTFSNPHIQSVKLEFNVEEAFHHSHPFTSCASVLSSYIHLTSGNLVSLTRIPLLLILLRRGIHHSNLIKDGYKS